MRTEETGVQVWHGFSRVLGACASSGSMPAKLLPTWWNATLKKVYSLQTSPLKGARKVAGVFLVVCHGPGRVSWKVS